MRPFEGIRVLDLTHVFAGPFCTFQLGVLGADVIKIEPPDNPDMTRDEGAVPALSAAGLGTHFQAQNAGKRAITLNLKSESGAQVMRRLVATADVLVQNYAGDAFADLGFGYDAVAEIKPDIIYCQMTGFGRTGPKANDPAYDVVIQAFSGLMSANGEADSKPVRVGPAIIDYGTGAQAALAISAALYQRHVTGKGQRIDVAMLDAALMLMTSSLSDTLATGKPPRAHGNISPLYAGYRTFATADGTIMIGAYTTRQNANLLEAVGEPERAKAVLAMTRDELRAARAEDSVLLEARMRERTASEWEAHLNAAHVPAARVRTLDEALASDQVASRSVVQSPATGALPAGGAATLPAAAFSYAHGSPSIDRPPPKFGEHTHDVLAELGYGAEDIAALHDGGAI